MKTTSKAAAALGARGGRAKSDAKTAAVRANGAKGGRPAHVVAILADVTPSRATVLWLGTGRDLDAPEVHEALAALELEPEHVDPSRVRLVSSSAKVGERIWL